MRLASTSFLTALLSLALLAGCATVPGTGRTQLNMVPLSTAMSLGAQAYDEQLAGEKVVTSGADLKMVTRVAERIAEAARRLYPDPAQEFSWEIVLINAPGTANAWALPGGKMAVYTGLLPITGDEASLAAVVGHEVAHAVARHGSERMSHGMVFEIALGMGEVWLGDMPIDDKSEILQAIGLVGQYGAILPFSRAHESEADLLGLMLAADAGYDPRAAVGLWQRMAASGGAGVPEFLSTHPSEATRIENLQAAMPEALQLYEAAKAR